MEESALPIRGEARPRDRYLAARQRDDLRPFVETWFSRMRQCGGDVRELMHDGCPTACVDDAGFVTSTRSKNHVNVGFFLGALLKDPARLLEGTGKRGRHVKLWPERQVNSAALASSSTRRTSTSRRDSGSERGLLRLADPKGSSREKLLLRLEPCAAAEKNLPAPTERRSRKPRRA